MNSNSNDSLPTHLPSQQSTPTEKCLAKYGNSAVGILISDQSSPAIFSPANCDRYSRNPFRCVNGSAPTLVVASKAYSERVVLQWLCDLLVHLSEYMGAKQKMTPYQMTCLAKNILAEYYYLKVTELMLFVSYAERGKLGVLDYGSFDPVRIMTLIAEFVDTYRAEQIDIAIRKEEDEKRQEADRRWRESKRRRLFSPDDTPDKTTNT